MYNYDYSDAYDYNNYGDGYYTTVGDTNDYVTSINNPYLDNYMAILPIISVISFILGLFMIISLWKIFKKAGKPGWASIVPIYNVIVLIESAGLSLWYLLLLFIPIVQIYAIFKIYIELAHKFGKSTGFGVASIFFPIICMPILAFGKCTYEDKKETNEPLNNNTGINTENFQNMVNNNENSTISNNANETVAPVIPAFVPNPDISNNISDVNNLNSVEVPTDVNNAAPPVQEPNVAEQTPEVNINPLPEVMPVAPTPEVVEEPNVNMVNNNVKVEVPIESQPVVNNEVITPVEVPVQNIPVVEEPSINIMDSVPTEMPTPEVSQPVNVPVEEVAVPNQIPEIQSIPNIETPQTNPIIPEVNNANQAEMPEIPVEQNITDTMSLNELLAGIDKESN